MFYQWPRSAGDWLSERAVPKALTLSVILHLLIFLLLDISVGVTPLFRGAKMSTLAEIREEARARAAAAAEAEREAPPMIFVEVDPTLQEEPAKETPFYSTTSSQAANPAPANETTPKIDGKEDTIPKTMDTARPTEAVPLQPTVTRPVERPIEQPEPQAEPTPPARTERVERVEPQKEAPQVESKPLEIQPARDALVIAQEPAIPPAQPPVAPAPRVTPRPQEKPRTLAEARQRQGLLAGERMRMEGGVRRERLEHTLDVKASPFGDYDAAFIAAVQNRWFQLLDERSFAGDHRGKVVLVFRLHPDGRVTHMHVAENTVTGTLSWLCQRAVEDPAPYGPFPEALKKMLKTEHREVRFTFHYR